MIGDEFTNFLYRISLYQVINQTILLTLQFSTKRITLVQVNHQTKILLVLALVKLIPRTNFQFLKWVGFYVDLRSPGLNFKVNQCANFHSMRIIRQT